MNISEFIRGFTNHPILFVGTGMSLRYLQTSYSWDDLLKRICFEFKGNDEYYLDIKAECEENSKYRYDKIASKIENEFNQLLKANRDGKFKEVNDLFYENMKNGHNISRLKIYISLLLKDLTFKPHKVSEIEALKKVRKNIGSIITTNYDTLLEEIFEFNPLIGNDILLSNPYGALYKIHGCISQPDKIIITENDYDIFNQKYELVRAQLLSLFIHHPIIFLGYSIGDENIKDILKTIFTYVEPNTSLAQEIRKKFLLVEYKEGLINTEVSEYDIDMEGFSTIRINKIKTDDYLSIFNELSLLQLPVSAMDIRKVQSVVKEIYAGGDIKVSITEDLDELDNKDKVLAIGSQNTIKYTYQSCTEIISNYFKIIDESNFQILELVDKVVIQNNQYFPIYAFAKINSEIERINTLKKQQKKKISSVLKRMKDTCKKEHHSIEDIKEDRDISVSSQVDAIFYSIITNNIPIETVETYLRNYPDKKTTEFRKLLCAYDFIKNKTEEDSL